MLEQESRKLTLDEKLKEIHQRKNLLLKNLQSKQQQYRP